MSNEKCSAWKWVAGNFTNTNIWLKHILDTLESLFFTSSRFKAPKKKLKFHPATKMWLIILSSNTSSHVHFSLYFKFIVTPFLFDSRKILKYGSRGLPCLFFYFYVHFSVMIYSIINKIICNSISLWQIDVCILLYILEYPL